jgi:HK97 family phage major capsid protein
LIKQSLTDRRAMLGRLQSELLNKRGALTESEVLQLRKYRIELDELEGDIKIEHSIKQDRAFVRWLTHGDEGLGAEQKSLVRELRTETVAGEGSGFATGGGTWVSVGFQDQVNTALKDYGPFFRLATVFDTPRGNNISWPTVNDTSVSGELLAENQQASTQDIAAPRQTTLGAYKFSSHIVLASIEFVQDQGVDFPSWLANQFAIRIERTASPYFHSGLGAASGQPMGVLTAGQSAGVAVGAYSNDHVSGANSIGTDDCANLEAALDSEYRKNATFLMNANTLALLRKVKNTIGSPVFPDLHGGQANAENRIFNYRVEVSPFVSPIQSTSSSPAVTTQPLIFADFSRYVIRRARPKLVRMDERFIDQGLLGFVLFYRIDGQLIGDPAAVQYLEVTY